MSHATPAYTAAKIARLEDEWSYNQDVARSMAKRALTAEAAVELYRGERDMWMGKYAATLKASQRAIRPTIQPAPVTQHSEAHQRGEHEGTVVWACYGCQTEEMF